MKNEEQRPPHLWGDFLAFMYSQKSSQYSKDTQSMKVSAADKTILLLEHKSNRSHLLCTVKKNPTTLHLGLKWKQILIIFLSFLKKLKFQHSQKCHNISLQYLCYTFAVNCLYFVHVKPCIAKLSRNSVLKFFKTKDLPAVCAQFCDFQF